MRAPAVPSTMCPGYGGLRLIQRRPEALTRWDLLERAASRYMALALIRLPHRARVSSMPNTSGSSSCAMADQKQKQSRLLKGREDGAVEDWWYSKPESSLNDTEGRCDGPLAWTEYGPDKQDLSLQPGPLLEQS